MARRKNLGDESCLDIDIHVSCVRCHLPRKKGDIFALAQVEKAFPGGEEFIMGLDGKFKVDLSS